MRNLFLPLALGASGCIGDGSVDSAVKPYEVHIQYNDTYVDDDCSNKVKDVLGKVNSSNRKAVLATAELVSDCMVAKTDRLVDCEVAEPFNYTCKEERFFLGSAALDLKEVKIVPEVDTNCKKAGDVISKNRSKTSRLNDPRAFEYAANHIREGVRLMVEACLEGETRQAAVCSIRYRADLNDRNYSLICSISL